MDKLRAITYFVRTVEAKSFAAAAHSLEVTPSALSKAIAVLEQDLAFALFNRSTRRMALTVEGVAYYNCCRKVLQDLEEVELAAGHGRARAAGVLRVGMHPAVSWAVLQEVHTFLEAYPELMVESVMTNSATALLDRGLDVVIHIGELRDSELVARQLGWTEFVVCAGPSYLKSLGMPQQPEDLWQYPAVVYARDDEDPATRWEFYKGREHRTISIPICLVLRGGIGLIEAAVRGCGVIRPYRVAARSALAAGQLVALLPDWSSDRQPVYAVFAQKGHIAAKVQAFLDFTQGLIAPNA